MRFSLLRQQREKDHLLASVAAAIQVQSISPKTAGGQQHVTVCACIFHCDLSVANCANNTTTSRACNERYFEYGESEIIYIRVQQMHVEALYMYMDVFNGQQL